MPPQTWLPRWASARRARLIAETGAGMHGVATATAGALLGQTGGERMARYRAIAADLAAKIRDGHYAPGEALPA